MNKLIIIFFISFSTLVLSQEKIYWSSEYKLQWKDFKAEPNIRRVAALSYCGIQFYSCYYRRGQAPTYRIRAYFEPKKSWSWKNYRYSYVLKHEQLHFDIAEIYARKIRKHFAENNIDIEDAVEEYQDFYDQYVAYQDLYDEETAHGTRDFIQKQWEDTVEEELESLSEYAEDDCY